MTVEIGLATTPRCQTKIHRVHFIFPIRCDLNDFLYLGFPQRKEIVMATNNSGLNSNFLQWREKGKKWGSENQQAMQSQRRGFVWKIYAASGNLFTDIWSWQSFVSSYYVLTAFSHWSTKWNTAGFNGFFCYLWLACLLGCAAWQKVIGNHLFQN